LCRKKKPSHEITINHHSAFLHFFSSYRPHSKLQHRPSSILRHQSKSYQYLLLTHCRACGWPSRSTGGARPIKMVPRPIPNPTINPSWPSLTMVCTVRAGYSHAGYSHNLVIVTSWQGTDFHHQKTAGYSHILRALVIVTITRGSGDRFPNLYKFAAGYSHRHPYRVPRKNASQATERIWAF
jgi:hypothetical protein